MGKATGFLEFERQEEHYEAPAARLKHYKEFVLHLSDEKAKVQSARCMDCGTPFCNSGCPVNNIIPDFNDMVFRNSWREALDTLHSTNNFPEFTGRICPAPCEAACTLNINDAPVGIKSIEHAIIDKGWEMGWVVAQPPVLKPAKQWPSSAPARPAWRPRNNSRALGTALPCLKKMIVSAACCAMAFLISKWKKPILIVAWISSKQRAFSFVWACWWASYPRAVLLPIGRKRP